MSVVIETTIGDVTIDLYILERPMTSKNFLKLCKMKYYNGSIFHFIQRDFIAQTGDPKNNGGQSAYSLTKDNGGHRFIESERKPKIKHDHFGLVSMVNNGENLHGSQFFFTLSDSLNYLDGVHTVFGQVTEGEDILIKLNDTICDERHRPYQDIMITHTVILDDPFPEIDGLIIPPESPRIPLEDLINSDRIGIGEDIIDPDKPPEEIEEELKDKEAKQRALVLEMIGDIPDAEVKPPENVLFVCKLNPVTREEDLEIIFSRFGKIISCEIIKDDKTGDSLQYGFIEFDKKEDCEKAYFKMDNVLIDDRRIHVDFSQSVSKIKWRGKGRGVDYLGDEEKSSSNQMKSLKYVESIGRHSDDRRQKRDHRDKERSSHHRSNHRGESDNRRYHQSSSHKRSSSSSSRRHGDSSSSHHKKGRHY